MEVQVRTEPGFSVLGIEGSGSADKAPEWIGLLWDQALSRSNEIKDLVNPDRRWELMSAVDEYLGGWKDQGKYLAGWQVKRGIKPPKGWTVWDVPEQTYAVIACAMGTYGEAFKFVVQQSLPKHGYEQAGAMRLVRQMYSTTRSFLRLVRKKNGAQSGFPFLYCPPQPLTTQLYTTLRILALRLGEYRSSWYHRRITIRCGMRAE